MYLFNGMGLGQVLHLFAAYPKQSVVVAAVAGMIAFVFNIAVGDAPMQRPEVQPPVIAMSVVAPAPGLDAWFGGPAR